MTNVESSMSHGMFHCDFGTVRTVHSVLDDQSQTGGNVCGLGDMVAATPRSRQMSGSMERSLSLVTVKETHRSSGLFSLK